MRGLWPLTHTTKGAYAVAASAELCNLVFQERTLSGIYIYIHEFIYIRTSVHTSVGIYALIYIFA